MVSEWITPKTTAKTNAYRDPVWTEVLMLLFFTFCSESNPVDKLWIKEYDCTFKLTYNIFKTLINDNNSNCSLLFFFFYEQEVIFCTQCSTAKVLHSVSFIKQALNDPSQPLFTIKG